MEQAVEAVVASYPDVVAYETAPVAVAAVETAPYQEPFIISFWILLLSLVVIAILVFEVILIVKFWKACNRIERIEKMLSSEKPMANR